MEDERINGYVTPEGEYLRLDDLEAIERAFARGCGDDPAGLFQGLRGVALDLAKEHRDEAARRFLARARELAAGSEGEAPRLLMLGVRFEEIERYDLAGECYEQGRALGARDPVSWYFLHNNHAYCLAMLGRHAEAEPLARAAIAIDRVRHNAHKNLGLALVGQGRLREAIECFRRASGLCPTDGRAAQHLADAERRLVGEAGRTLH